METQTSELQAILHRVERLEKQNRMLKQLGLLAVVLLGSLLLMAQARSTPKAVGASLFTLHDADGNIRAKLALCADSPCLSFLDREGKESMKLSEYLFQMGGNTDKGGVVQIEAASAGPPIDMKASPEEIRKAIQAGSSFTKPVASIRLGNDKDKSNLSLAVEGSEADLRIHDSSGFETVLGNTDLVTERTGESRKTSAASVVLFGKDSKVLWSAP